jgi:hypothetical protein
MAWLSLEFPTHKMEVRTDTIPNFANAQLRKIEFSGGFLSKRNIIYLRLYFP